MIILMVAFSMVLVGMAALVIDVGALHDEKRQLQNGADAGALAVARSCALGACDASAATSLANSNAKDGSSNVVVSPAGPIPPATKRVSVTTSTRTGATSILPYSFAQILTGRDGQSVSATATATWGPVGRATVLRLATSQCDVKRLPISTVDATITFHDPDSSCVAGSGADRPGNFGWLEDDGIGSGCELTIDSGVEHPGKNGNMPAPGDCLLPYLNKEILLPVFDESVGESRPGGNATYMVTGFARFHLSAYRFGNKSGGVPQPCSGSVNCIRGYFVSYVVASGDLGGTGFGVSTVRLVS